MKNKNFTDIEKLLRDAKLPDQDTANVRHRMWRKLVAAQRNRRNHRAFFKISPWVWPIASILLVLLFIFFILWLGR